MEKAAMKKLSEAETAESFQKYGQKVTHAMTFHLCGGGISSRCSTSRSDGCSNGEVSQRVLN